MNQEQLNVMLISNEEIKDIKIVKIIDDSGV